MDIEAAQKHIESKTPFRGQIVVICGGTYPDRPIVHTQICFFCADGIDDTLPGPSYLDMIIEMKPKIVILCVSHGARYMGKKLSDGGIRNLFWARCPIKQIDCQILFNHILVPCCEDLLVKYETIRTSLKRFHLHMKKALDKIGSKPHVIDNSWYGNWSEVDDIPLARFSNEVGTSYGGAGVITCNSDFGNARMFGFDRKNFSSYVYRASNLPLMEILKMKLQRQIQTIQDVRILDFYM